KDGIRHRNVTGVQTCALPILTLFYPPQSDRQLQLLFFSFVFPCYLFFYFLFFYSYARYASYIQTYFSNLACIEISMSAVGSSFCTEANGIPSSRISVIICLLSFVNLAIISFSLSSVFASYTFDSFKYLIFFTYCFLSIINV